MLRVLLLVSFGRTLAVESFRNYENLVKKWLSIFFLYLGNRSYVIYLLHFPFLWIATNSSVFRNVNTSLKIFLSLLVTAICSEFIHRNFEFSLVQKSRSIFFKEKLLLLVKPTFVSIFILFLFTFGIEKNFFGVQNLDYFQSKHGNDTKPIAAWETNRGCSFLYSTKVCSFDYGFRNSRHLLLIGDSHSAQFAEEIRNESFEKSMNLSIWTKANCTYISPQSILKFKLSSIQIDGIQSNDCGVHNRHILQLLRREKFDSVVISPRFTSPSNLVDNVVYQALITSTIIELRGFTTNLVLIGPNPEFPKYYGPGLRTFWQKAQYFALPLQRMDKRAINDDLNFRDLSKKMNLNYISVVRLTCKNNKCANNDGTGFVYWDENHLSVLGASKISKELSELL
jgi:hypothetical protein